MKNPLKKILTMLIISISTYAYSANYFVAKTGSDENPGTQAAPFKTIAKASSLAIAGDTCYIRGGTYEETLEPANSGTENAPIIFTAFPGEKVIITAMQTLQNWELDEGLIYKTQTDWDLGQENLIMIGDTVCDLARWPNNTDGDLFTLNALRNTGGSNKNVIENAYITYRDGIPNFDWSKGGSLFFYGDGSGSGWTTWRSFITDNNATQVFFQLPQSWIGSAHSPDDRGEFFLQGVKEAIDYDNEWYFDPETKTLYLQLPDGRKPKDNEVSMRKRKSTILLNNKHHIHIYNLAVFGGQIDILDRSSHNRINKVSSYYGSHTTGVIDGPLSNSQAVNVRGNNNIISNCEIAWGAGSGVWIGSQYWDGSDGLNNQLINSNIHDFNYLGCYDAPVMVRGSNSTIIKQNTIYRGGRDCIQIVDNNCEVAYNNIHQSNLIANDCGLLYTIGGPRHTSIHHNWFHDTQARGTLYKACGIYLDNDSSGFDVYRNVVWNTEWTSLQINWNGIDINVFNNTFWNAQKVMGAWHKAGTAFENVKVYNNISNDDKWEPQSDRQNNLTVAGGPTFVDANGGNFHLKNGSSAIDNGRIIEGYVEQFIGTAPDVGAYEKDGVIWVAGISWDHRKGPANVGAYNLPGEDYGFQRRSAWNDMPRTLPGKIECEDFDIGLQHIAYYDTTPGNSGNIYRIPHQTGTTTITQPETATFGAYDVDIEKIGNEQYAISDTVTGEWLEYTVWINERGSYQLNIHYATTTEDAKIKLLVNDNTSEDSIELPVTESPNHFELKSSDIDLPYGKTVIRLLLEANDIRLNSLQFHKN